MNVQLKEVINAIKSGGGKVSVDTITQLGLLIERASMDRYGDPVYEDLGMPPDWLELRLSSHELDELLATLVELLNSDAELAPTAAWALGKAFSGSTVPGLIAALDKYWRSDDETAYQILIALDNHGKEGAIDLIRLIASKGHGKSQEFARELSARTPKH
jgi:hypothetical protein